MALKRKRQEDDNKARSLSSFVEEAKTFSPNALKSGSAGNAASLGGEVKRREESKEATTTRAVTTPKATRVASLPKEIWKEVAKYVNVDKDLFAFASTCKHFRQFQKEVLELRERKSLRTVVHLYSRQGKEKYRVASRGWIRWAFTSLKGRRRLEGWLIELAAFCGYTEEVAWLRDQGCPWNHWVSAAAAEGGALNVLKWLRSEDCPWDSRTCSYAARWGHLHVLKWARSEGCPWDAKLCDYAAKEHHYHILSWASARCQEEGHAGNHSIMEWFSKHKRWLDGLGL